jgi:hypothetical protein
MQPEPTQAIHNIPTPENTPPPSATSHHGQRLEHDLQDSLQPHSGELREAPEPPRGDQGDATGSRATSADGNTLEPLGLRGSKASTPPPRDRISEYENARVKTPKKPAEGPLFEVIKSNRRPDDKSSAIAKLPNGECSASRGWTGHCLACIETNTPQRS